MVEGKCGEYGGDPKQLDLTDLKPAEKKTNFGKNKWYWQKTWEVANPESPLTRLSLSAEYLLDRMTGLVSVKKNWIICASLPRLVRECHGKLKRSAISYLLDELTSQGFAKRVVLTKKRVAQVFIVNPIMMAEERASLFANYAIASKLVIELKPVQPKAKKASRRKPLSREEQLKFAKEEIERAKASTDPAASLQ